MRLNDIITDADFEKLAQKLAERVASILESRQNKQPVYFDTARIGKLLAQGKRKEAKILLRANR